MIAGFDCNVNDYSEKMEVQLYKICCKIRVFWNIMVDNLVLKLHNI